MTLRLLALVMIGWALGLQMAVGYLAAPVLFGHMEPARAGELVGILLVWAEAVTLVVVAAVSFLSQSMWHRGLLLFVMLIQLAQLGWLNPEMARLKAQGLSQLSVQQAFMTLHGVSQGLFLLALVLLMLWLGLQLRRVGMDKSCL